MLENCPIVLPVQRITPSISTDIVCQPQLDPICSADALWACRAKSTRKWNWRRVFDYVVPCRWPDMGLIDNEWLNHGGVHVNIGACCFPQTVPVPVMPVVIPFSASSCVAFCPLLLIAWNMSNLRLVPFGVLRRFVHHGRLSSLRFI